MPIYEYKCPNGHLIEVFHGMMEAGPEVCEVCGEGPLQRVLHPVAVHYKGSGFYSTDYDGRERSRPRRGPGVVLLVRLVVVILGRGLVRPADTRSPEDDDDESDEEDDSPAPSLDGFFPFRP